MRTPRRILHLYEYLFKDAQAPCGPLALQSELCRTWTETGACKYGEKCQVRVSPEFQPKRGYASEGARVAACPDERVVCPHLHNTVHSSTTLAHCMHVRGIAGYVGSFA